ncbi:adenosylmethionine decarboxylase [Vulcanococcus limneticus]|uniref:adenosylmethionine decarboxylase n=1 Tax=Vulcanococcus limneticus TaxID=2170428 RepID=UPI00398BD11B
MSFAFRYFHPNPGWSTDSAGSTLTPATSLNELNELKELNEIVVTPIATATPAPITAPIADTVGKHCILELYACDCAKLDDEDFVRAALSNAALRAGATLLNLISHHFQPHGVTGLALLAESHISFHSWPESGYAAVDVFTCGDHTMPESACRVLVEEFGSRHHQLRSFRRETPAMIAALERQPAAIDGLPVPPR